MTRAEYILGIDYGSRRVGVALAHYIARLPKPFATLANDEKLIETLQDIIQREGVQRVVVGVPRSMNGDVTAQTGVCEAFAQQLSKVVAVPVETTDETLSSVEAEALLTGRKPYEKSQVDALAASLILERYFLELAQEVYS